MESTGVQRGEGSRHSVANAEIPDLMPVREFKELRVYQQAYDAATEIFEHSKEWPKEETYSLTDQIRRSSRSVCANIAEAWRKRRYENHFVSKLSDADAEAAETRTWLSSDVTADTSLKSLLRTSIAPTITFAEAS